MIVHIPFSSSDGNACRVYTQSTSILLDCGVSKRMLFSESPFPLDAVFVSHHHNDHIRGTGIIARATGATVFLQQEVHRHITLRNSTFYKNCSIEYIQAGKKYDIGDLQVEVQETSHDGIGGLYFIVTEMETGQRYGHLTDTGIITEKMVSDLQSCHGLLLEANHDRSILDSYPEYPEFLKARIRGDRGHLSNRQILDFIAERLNLDQISWIAFGHLSPRTNHPDIVLQTACDEFPDYDRFKIAPACLPL